ncbi:hypothetical protein K474DRAFT_1605301 [Panus rudis PR-1116 ss-1]|nr:hypothetical protein K474DRAFT_1605301 [Panus rudis PR-1116 ss-1]
MSRPQYDNSSAEPTPKSSTSRQSWEPPRRGASTSEQASPSPQAVPSSSSEGYPSWLPRRPPPPAPRSTIHSTSAGGMFNDPGSSAGTTEPFVGGRKPTPRSVRIVSLQNSIPDKDVYGRREATDPSRLSAAAHARVWSRATSAGLTPTLFSSTPLQSNIPKPRFRSSTFHPELLRHPSWKMRLWFYLFPIFVFFHLPLQTFFDFNAVYILLLVAKFPNPIAPGVPGSGRNWALGAAAYIACWFTQIFVVFLIYELLYSFVRRWRFKRPLILPLYLSSPGFNFTCMTSYTNFCFMYFIRISAFKPFASTSSGSESDERLTHSSGLRDGLAETFYYYSQNLPTVALLLPRAALSLALLLAYASPKSFPEGDTGVFSRRDGTFFRAEDGTLTGYARGVLIANAAWTAWRILVLLVSWIGLWIFSGQGCAGLCGPRYRWEEEEIAEKTTGPFSFADNASEHLDTPLPWSWRENTVVRVYEAWEFCLTNKLPARSGGGAGGEKGGDDGRDESMGFEGMEKVFAAVGLGGAPHPTKRPILTGELFESPQPQDVEAGGSRTPEKTLSHIIPPPAAAQTKDKSPVPGKSGPISKLPYPFTGYGAQVSSEDVIPFPPSPEIEDHELETSPEEGGDEEDHEHEEEEEDSGGLEDSGDGLEGDVDESEVPSSERRTSGSMSSLGHPIVSRYPFTFRRPGRGGSVSSSSQFAPPTSTNVSTPVSRHTHSSNPSHSTQSRSTRNSRSTQSTGNPESTDSPMSVSSNGQSPMSSFSGGAIPMPPRHPQRRSRAGTVPSFASPPSSPSPVVFPAGRPRARTRTESLATDTSITFGTGPIPLAGFDHSDDEDDEDEYRRQEASLMDVPEAEGSVEEAEQHDSVGLLSVGPSPRASQVNLHQFGSRLSLGRRTNGSRSRSATSRSNSRSRTNSATSRSESARSRAQSLIQSLHAASRSSLELVRSRANSMARISDSPYYSTSPDPLPSSPENYTFGHPIREQWREAEAENDETERAQHEQDVSEATAVPLPMSRSEQSGHGSPSDIPQSPPLVHTEPVNVPPIPIPGRSVQNQGYAESHADISTAHQSFVAAPATIEGTTDTSGRTPSSWGGISNFAQGAAWRPA